jgi:hypothetical protein
MKHLFRVAQLADPAAAPAMPPPPPPPAPPMGGGFDPMAPMPPMGGMGPMGADPMGGMGAPPPPPSGGDRQEIIGPIKSLAQIFYDMDVAKFIQNNLHVDHDKLTKKIWADYGGKENGKPNYSYLGQRTEKNNDLSPEEAAEERNSTEDSKWERFEKGKNIADVISYDDLGKVVEGLVYGVVQKASAAAAAPPGGAPMGGGIMAANKARIIIAQALERQGEYYLSDTIINNILEK